ARSSRRSGSRFASSCPRAPTWSCSSRSTRTGSAARRPSTASGIDLRSSSAALLFLVLLAACQHGALAPSPDRLIHVNEVQVRGTHNSYQPPLAALDRQLDGGVRQLELDVWAQPDGRFAVYHSANDKRTTCVTLDECLAPARMWLLGHRRAVPVYLVIEDKDLSGAGTAQELDALDEAVAADLPGRLLVRPSEVL